MEDFKRLKSTADLTKRSKSLHHLEKDVDVLTSLVPDEVIYNCKTRSLRNYECVLLLGDISGFTLLCEKYSKERPGRISRLTDILNSYLGTLVHRIVKHEGDVLKFSGDAFLAMWKTDRLSLSEVVSVALACAIELQSYCGIHESDMNVVLSLKIGVAAGEIVFAVIGTDDIKHYIVVGDPIFDLKKAESACKAGQIMVSDSVFQKAREGYYTFKETDEGKFYVLLGTGPRWGANNITKLLRNQDGDDLRPVSTTSIGRVLTRAGPVDFSDKEELKDALLPFMIRLVRRAIEVREPIESLTEMREVVIVFINVILDRIDKEGMVLLIDRCFCIVCEVANAIQACVDKVSLFDKDLMFLLILGLRGNKQDLERRIALRAALQVRTPLLTVMHVASVSAAVTSGSTYCGIVGHTWRREYTVIGSAVNRAARLMVAYPGKVTCDRSTFLNSRLEASQFLLQESRPLKGISDVGPVYEFVGPGAQSVPAGAERLRIAAGPLLGRRRDMRLFARLLVMLLDDEPDRHTAIAVLGKPRQGKSRLLAEMVGAVPSECRSRLLVLGPRDYDTPYAAIRALLAPALCQGDSACAKERADSISVKLTGYPQLLYALNEPLGLTFPEPDGWKSPTAEQKSRLEAEAVAVLAAATFDQPTVLAIDNCELTDEHSWPLMEALLSKSECVSEQSRMPALLLLLSLGSRRPLSETARVVLSSPSIYRVRLTGIPRKYHSALICQMLGVVAVPAQLERFVQERSEGSPGWIDNLVLSLMQGGVLKQRTVPASQLNAVAASLKLAMPPSHMVVRKPKAEDLSDIKLDGKIPPCEGTDTWWEPKRAEDSSPDVSRVSWKIYRPCIEHKTSGKESQGEEDVLVCTVKTEKELSEALGECARAATEQRNIAIQAFDQLTRDSQHVTKMSSALGERFPRAMLRWVLRLGRNERNIRLALAVADLFESAVLCCGQLGRRVSSSGRTYAEGRSGRLRMHTPVATRNSIGGLSPVGGRKSDDGRSSVGGRTSVDTRMSVDKAASVDGRTPIGGRKYVDGRTSLDARTSVSRALSVDARSKSSSLHSPPASREIYSPECGCQDVKIPEEGAQLPYYAWCNYLEFRSSSFRNVVYSLLTDSQRTEYHELAVNYLEQETRRCAACGGGQLFLKLESSLHGGMILLTHRGRTAMVGRQVTHLKLKKPWVHRLRKLAQSKKQSRVEIPTFSRLLHLLRDAADFRDCQCSRILCEVYGEYVLHCRGAGLRAKEVSALLELGFLCLQPSVRNPMRAMALLREARAVLDAGLLREDVPLSSRQEGWSTRVVSARLNIVLGTCHLQLDQLDQAEEKLRAAMTTLGCEPPRFLMTKVRCSALLRYIRYKLHNEGCVISTMEDSLQAFLYEGEFQVVDIAAEQEESVCMCLTQMSRLMWRRGDVLHAQLYATFALLRAAKCQSAITMITRCQAFACALRRFCVAENQQHWLQEESLRMVIKICDWPLSFDGNIDQQAAVSFLVRAVFAGMMVQSDANLVRLQEVGDTALSLCSNSCTPSVFVTVCVARVLLGSGRIQQAVEHLNELRELWRLFSARALYLLTVLDLQLDTARVLHSFRDNKVAAHEMPQAERQAGPGIAAGIWVWALRHSDWETADIWQQLALEEAITLKDGGTCAPWGSIWTRTLEGALLHLVNLIDDHDMRSLREWRPMVKRLHSMARAKCRGLGRARFLHMSAYWNHIEGNQKKAKQTLSLGMKHAENNDQVLEAGWMRHTHSWWKTGRGGSADNSWLRYSREDGVPPHSAVYYTLPTPREPL